MQSFSSKTFGSFKLSRILWCVFSFFISLAAFAAIAGCNRASSSSQGNAAWVSAPEAVLRDRVATVYSKSAFSWTSRPSTN